jgi:hypothetical protein
MENDNELSAMATVNAALSGLEPDAVSRVLRWAADRYHVTLASTGRNSRTGKEGDASNTNGEVEADQTYNHFSDFYDAADPTSITDSVLVAAYWFQVINGQDELESQALNTELKQTGHGVDHMPHALDDLMQAKPRLMIQTKKQGTAKQARRKFKLTTEGIKRVQSMLKKSRE